MSLDFSKLENVRVCGNKTTARCPACAEAGRDRRGEHLFQNEEGRFGCVVYPGISPDAKAHRKRIFAMCGGRDVMALAVHQHVEHSPKAIKNRCVRTLIRVFQTHEERNDEDIFSAEQLSEFEGGVLSVLKTG